MRDSFRNVSRDSLRDSSTWTEPSSFIDVGEEEERRNVNNNNKRRRRRRRRRRKRRRWVGGEWSEGVVEQERKKERKEKEEREREREKKKMKMKEKENGRAKDVGMRQHLLKSDPSHLSSSFI